MRPYIRSGIIFVSSVLLVNCGGGGGNSSQPQSPNTTLSHLYVVNSGDWTVSTFEISPTGQLALIQSGVPAGVTSPSGIAIHPAGALYIGSGDSRNIATFPIDPKTGKLSSALGVPNLGASPLSWNNAEKLALCHSQLVSFGDSFTDLQRTGIATRFGWGGTNFTADTTGFITLGYLGSFGFGIGDPQPSNPSAAPDANCTVIFHANTATNMVVGSINDAAKHLGGTYGNPVAAGSAPVDLATDAAFKFLYTSNSGSNNVSAFVIDPTAQSLTPVPGSPFPAGLQPNSLLVVGSWLYVTNGGDRTVSAFSIDSTTGTLTTVAGSPFTVGTNPSALMPANTDLSHSPTGLLLYVANQGSNSLSGFVVATGGALQPISDSPFPSGNAPKGMAVAPPPQ